MKHVFYVTWDVILEALRRRWIIALVAITTIFFLGMAASLELEVIDGALAASKLFGDALDQRSIQSVDVAMRPVFQGMSYVLFYGTLIFGTFASADFAPRLLAPGRIEHLLSLPMPRWALPLGTFLGVNLVMLAISLYGAAGITIVLGVKTGVFMPRLLVSAVWGIVSFSAVYASMLLMTLFVRSAAAGSIAGTLVICAGAVSSFRPQVLEAFSSDIARELFAGVSYFLPPLSSAGISAANYVAHEPVAIPQATLQLVGIGLFGLATVVIAMMRFEKMDF